MKAYTNQQNERMKKLNINGQDVQETARKYGLTESQVISMLEIQNYKKRTGEDYKISK